MSTLTNVLTIQEKRRDFHLKDGLSEIIDGSKYIALSGLIDPHVHFRTPGMEHKEDWISGARAAFNGGYTTVFDMPNTLPPTTTFDRLREKISLIDLQISQSSLPLKYRLFFGADKNNFHEIVKVKNQIIGIKIFMGSSTGELLMDDESSLHAIYALAKAFNLIIAVHAEDELTIKSNNLKYPNVTEFKYHSLIRSVEAATKAVSLVIKLSSIYQVKSYVLHISTKDEIDLIRDAKAQNIPVYAETCPHYLFLDDECYDQLQGMAKMNPPLRHQSHQSHLWHALNDGTLDTIASDHAPHSLAEKSQQLCKCPSGVPGIETTLPLMLTAYKEGKIDLIKLEQLLVVNAQNIFNIAPNQDIVFANIVDYRLLSIDNLYTKAKWSPFNNMLLTGYPEYIFSSNKLFKVGN